MKLRNSYRVWVLVVVLVMLGVMVIPAGASSPPLRVKWVFNVSFENGVINATRENTLMVGNQTILSWTDSSPDIDCQPAGNVAIGVDSALFGGGFIKCDLSSLQLSTLIATNYQVQLPDVCPMSSPQFDMWARVNVANPNFGSTNSLPLIWHPDYSMNYYLNETSANTGSLTLTSGTNRTITSSNFNILPNVLQMVGSRIHPCNGTNCIGNHFVNGQSLSTGMTQDELFLGTTLETTIYIGYDGVDVFTGEMGDIQLDPGCVPEPG